jgi:hypothetical protein
LFFTIFCSAKKLNVFHKKPGVFWGRWLHTARTAYFSFHERKVVFFMSGKCMYENRFLSTGDMFSKSEMCSIREKRS